MIAETYQAGRLRKAPELPACNCCGRPLPESRITIYDHRGYTFVSAAEVTMLRASMKYIEVWSRAGLHGLIETSLDALAARYPRLLRIHKAILVAPDAITHIGFRSAYGGRQLREAHILGANGPVPIARREWRAVQGRLRRGQ